VGKKKVDKQLPPEEAQKQLPPEDPQHSPRQPSAK